MWSWFDGHMVLALIGCPTLAFLIVGNANARLVRRCQQRAEIMHRRGAR